ncbi:MAG: NADH:ubiquinone reductase (Na(+)-transporting) subunit B [Lentimicrobium sp.]|jgi:Na+-transporting NADH:ubiquinone oxidoreductase subunit B|nr:NADH:ubiquinone reductase (Na(+)-transporting) subunit B [Lentimicrobium sp.]MDD2527712.1 NADH:ubiquinone reductase (Na(+)-transporting) subunit B [Lentimicrobiaceae bacterium]MDD4597437.1 NADH:ubiquinone reductase (Na(+)-transporting) subunit B [Lentimicrobiaceae bacterium]MDY0026453.1 NADH:ubiquinone reductase (Na(+)-transporting) subunit B [Lentimicrobium sp.]HAH58064.1 NADH:ubiquinone reductase (Na(+)-transporting) subunit B [Bacteroidales bacterium]
MKALRRTLDKMKPQFQKGGKFEKLHSTFDAFETFLFVPDITTSRGSHIRDANDMKRTMVIVVIALIPALLFGIWNVGFQHFISIGETATFWDNVLFGLGKVLPIIVVSYVVGLGIEFAFAQIRHHEVNEGFLVSGMLIPLVLPPDTPLWMVALSTAFAVVIGKEVFGGTGMNILNPALTARAFLFFAYPASMSGDKVWIAEKADAFSGATPLAEAAASVSSGKAIEFSHSISDMFFGFIPGSIGETSTLAILIGAAILIITGVGSLRIMLSVVVGGLFMGGLLNIFAINPYMAMPAYIHLIAGGFAFGTVYMATDPVTASQTNKGKLIFGFLVGIMAVLIRVLNPAYPEGMMLAILLMNVFAPLIDHYVVQANIKRRLKRIPKPVKA